MKKTNLKRHKVVGWRLSGLFVGEPVGGGAGFLYGAISGAVFSSLDFLRYG